MTSLPKPFVSVVTPVYNGAKYLAECIESVLSQTYPAFEYLIVDNASTDDSLNLARSYEKRDNRVRVVTCDDHFSNHLMHWNRSLRLVSPEAAHVKVVHADDWLFDECLVRMVDVAEENPSVGLVSSYRLDEDRVTLDGLPPSTTVVSGRDIARSFLLGGPFPFLFGSPTSILVRADLVRKRDPFYNEDNIHADPEACLAVLSESDFGFVHQVLTYTRRHNQSVTAFITRIGTAMPADLDMFQRWGPVFLSEDEYDRKQFVRLIHYAAFLAAKPSGWHRREFREYHRDRLRVFVERTSPQQLAHGARLQLRRSLARAADSLSSPPAGQSSA